MTNPWMAHHFVQAARDGYLNVSRRYTWLLWHERKVVCWKVQHVGFDEDFRFNLLGVLDDALADAFPEDLHQHWELGQFHS